MAATVTEHLRQHLLGGLGYAAPAKRAPDLPALIAVQWCQRFADLMRNRMVMGHFRYGPLDDQPDYDHMEAIERKVRLYRETGNGEYLVDIANYAHAEFAQGKFRFFHSDDDTNHMQVKA